MNDQSTPPMEGTCGVCGRLMPDILASNLCFIVLEKRDPIKLQEPELQGTFLKIEFIKTPGMTASGLYTPRDSSARKAGFDLAFLLCSEACGLRLSEAIVTDAQFISKLVLQ